MVVYHAAYDLTVYDGANLDLSGPAWSIVQHGTASLFLGLVGISFAVAWDRSLRGRGRRAAVVRTLRRAVMVLAAGVLVSMATYIVDPQTYVRFGILQLIGISMLLLPLFVPLRELAAIVGLGVMALGPLAAQAPAASPLLLPFGAMPAGFESVDYFPILPWFGVVLIGYAIGSYVYVRHRAARGTGLIGNPPAGLTWPGRHALPIYLVHQPVLLLLFAVLLGARFPGGQL